MNVLGNLAIMYELGLGGEQHPAKAFLYFTFAAFSGHLPSQMVIAYRHSDVDCEKAVSLYQPLAEEG